MRAYDWSGFSSPGSRMGAAHMGKNKTRGHSRYSRPEKIIERRASRPLGVEIMRMARFQVPPL